MKEICLALPDMRVKLKLYSMMFVLLLGMLISMNYTNAYTFVDGSTGCENATFTINNTDKSLNLGFNYKSVILNKMTPFIILESGNKHYIKDLLPTYSNRLNFSINKLSCGQWKFGLNLSIPQQVNVNYLGFSYENVIGNPNIELNREDQTVRINNGNAEMIIDWSDIANKVSLDKTNKEVLINITGIKNINIDPTIQFSTAAVEWPELSPLNNNTFVLTWCDETANTINFVVYDTNGTNTTPVVIVDNNVSSCFDYGRSVSVSAFNSTHFVIGYVDLTDNDVTFSTYDIFGTLVAGPIDVDTDIGTQASVSVSTFDSTNFVIGYSDKTDLDVTYAIYNILGTKLAGPTDEDTDITLARQVRVSTFSPTSWIISYMDATDNDITYSIYSWTTRSKGPSDADSSAAFDTLGDMIALNSTHFVIFWGEYSGGFVFGINDTTTAGVDIPQTTVDTSSSGSCSGTLAPLNSINFIVTWLKISCTYYSIYDSSKNLIYGPINMSSSTYLAAASFEPTTNIGFCNNNFVLAVVSNTTSASFSTYQQDGTAWDGICNIAPTWSNNISSYPSSYSPTNATQLNVTWSDDLDSNGYNFSYIQIDSTNYTSNRDGSKSYYSVVLPAGTHSWRAYANDSSNLWKSTDTWTFTINNGTNTVSLYFRNSTGEYLNQNMTVTYETATNFTGICTSGTCGIYKDDASTTANNTSVIRGYGTYKVTLNSTGNANYSSNTTSHYIIVNQKNANIQVYPITQTITYGTSMLQYYTNSSTLVTPKIYRNDTEVTNGTSIILGAGAYSFTANITDAVNYTSTTDTETLTVNKAPTSVKLYLNGSLEDTSYGQNTVANITGTVNISTLTVYLDMNATGWGNNFDSGTGSVVNESTLSMGLGIYNVTAHFDGDSNYTASSDISWLTVGDSTKPIFSNIEETPTDPATYSPNQVYYFNITWTDDTGIDTVIFNWQGTNITTGITNTTSEYMINRTDLSAGSYSYKWYANDTSGNDAVTTTQSYTINNATPNVMTYINNISSNYTGTYNFSIEVRGNSTTTQSTLTFNLYVSGRTSSGNPAIITADEGAGTYQVVYNTSGNQNYSTASNSTLYLIVEKASNPTDLYFRNSTGEYKNQNMTVTYLTQTNVTGICSQGDCTLLRNGTVATENNTLYTLPSGYWNYTVNTSGNANYTSNSSTAYITVNDKSTTASFSPVYSPIYNDSVQTVQGTYRYDSTDLTDNCSLTVQSVTYYDSNPYSWSFLVTQVGTVSWSVTCWHTNYTNATSSGTFTSLTGAGGGGDGGGGETGTTIPVVTTIPSLTTTTPSGFKLGNIQLPSLDSTMVFASIILGGGYMIYKEYQTRERRKRRRNVIEV